MHLTTAARRVSSWIAIFAVVVASIVPAVSHALKGSGDGEWIEICTVDGAKWVSADGTGHSGTAPTPAGHALKHCPACTLHASTLGLAPAPLAGLVAPALQFEVPRLILAAPRTLYAWFTAQPRAPPLLT